MNNPRDGAAQDNTEVSKTHAFKSSNNSAEFWSTMNTQIENSTQAPVSNSSVPGGSKIDSVNGRLLSWGCGEFGQHGHGHTEDVLPGQAYLENFYQCFGMDVRIKAISCGGSHTVIVTGEIEKLTICTMQGLTFISTYVRIIFDSHKINYENQQILNW